MSEVRADNRSIGFFDSSSGGLTVLRSVRATMPEYSYVYFADTANAPYGVRSQEEVRMLTECAVRRMFALGCDLVILACNTASATALRHIQQHILPKEFPGRRVLGVIVPTIEVVTARPHERVGVIATASTVNSHVYDTELKKRNAHLAIIEYAAPELASLIEKNEVALATTQLQEAISALERSGCHTIVLGCTHYALIKDRMTHVDNATMIVSQDDIIPTRLKEYLERHKALAQTLTRNASASFYLTAPHAYTEERIRDWFPASTITFERPTD